MKAITHDVFSLGIGLYFVCQVERSATLPCLVLVVCLAFAINELIDLVLTERGIYSRKRRFALAHLRYDNPFLNGAFVALGVLLTFAALT